MTIAVIIRCRNEEAHIGRLLTGLMRQRQRPDEIVVVDSGSTDATVSIASAFPTTVVHIAPEDFSFGRACNVGIQASQADIAVFISAHCYPLYDTWLEQLVDPFSSPDVALTYGRQTGPPGVRFSEQRLFETWFPEASEPRQRHPFCNNANAAVRRTLWEQLPYDEYLTGLEDLHWAKRALDRGQVLAYVAEAPVAHVHEERFAQVVNRYRREAIAHKQIYDDQKMPLTDAARLATANVFSDWRAAFRAQSVPRTYLSIGKFRAAQFLGTYQGFAQQGPVPALLKRRFYYPDDSGAATRSSSLAGAEHRPIDYDAPLDPAELRLFQCGGGPIR